jgi:hypothetical protein
MDEDLSEVRALRRRICERYTVSFFRSPDELAGVVATSVSNRLRRADSSSSADRPFDPSDVGVYRSCIASLERELDSQIRLWAVTGGAIIVGAVSIFGWAVVTLTGAYQVIVVLSSGLFASASIFPGAVMLSERKRRAILSGYADGLRKEPPLHAAVMAVKRFLEEGVYSLRSQ